MKICIPIDFKPQGGGFYFIKALSNYLAEQGWVITKRLSDRYDIIFTNHWQVPRAQILRAIRYNPRVIIVQRIDGAAQDYGRYGDADHRQRQVNQLADLTIFQSNYCRYSTREKFPVIVHNGPVINNPVDVDLFNPDGPRLSFPGSVRVACVTWSTNPFKGADYIYEVARRNPEVSFVLCGQYSDTPSIPNIHLQGVLSREELAKTLRSCHVLLTFSQNEACPNHVLEALASGLPILYLDSGAMSEVIGDCGLKVTIETFLSQLKQIMDRREVLSKKARQRVLKHFHPQLVFSRYIDVMQDALKHPTTIPVAYRLWLSWSEPVRLRCWQALTGLRKRFST